MRALGGLHPYRGRLATPRTQAAGVQKAALAQLCLSAYDRFLPSTGRWFSPWRDFVPACWIECCAGTSVVEPDARCGWRPRRGAHLD